MRHGGRLDVLAFALETGRTYERSFDAAETMRESDLLRYDSRRLLYRMIIEKPVERRESKSKLNGKSRHNGYEAAAQPASQAPRRHIVYETAPKPVTEQPPSPASGEAYEVAAQAPRRARRGRRRVEVAVPGAGFSHGEAVDVPVLDAYDGDVGDAVPEAYETAAEPESAGESIQAAEPYVMQEPAAEPETEEAPSIPVSLEEARRRIRSYFSDSGEEIMGWSDFRDIGVIKRYVERLETDGFLVREGSGFVLGNGSRHEAQATGKTYDPDWLKNWRAMSEGKTVTTRTRDQGPAEPAPERRRGRLAESAEKRFADYFLEKENGEYAAPKDELLAAGFTEDEIRLGIIGGALGIGNEGFVLSMPLLKRYKPEEPATGGNGSEDGSGNGRETYRHAPKRTDAYVPRQPESEYERVLRNLHDNGGTKYAISPEKLLELAGRKLEVVRHLKDQGYVRLDGGKFRMTQKGADSLLAEAVR